MISHIARDAVLAAAASGDLPVTATLRARRMGNLFAMTVVGADDRSARAGLALAAHLEARWSRFLTDSDITSLNLAEGAVRQVHPHTVRLVREMLDAHRRTDGDFDPTLLPALVAAGYGTSRVDPGRSTLLPASAVAPGRVDSISIDGDHVSLGRGTTLDPGGIGKGLAADLAVEQAIADGALGAMAQFGGDVVVGGHAPDGVAWRIGVEDPFQPGRHLAVIRLARGAVATSSRRKLRWTAPDGTQAHHLLDPRSIRSIETDVQAVTVIAPTGARAESLTKPGFLRPLDAFLAWLPTQGAAGLAVTADGGEHVSPNWSRYR
ncbi:FAD:protein FMN transferase [Microbacterium sp.]|uniref:FAD:protein FMN transferase n=1 Tax=Microbacterium sp. TaxID=51671 RepID=UPI0025FF367A|nr:FAD:protein FMN transferase [Microbacterium sp.]